LELGGEKRSAYERAINLGRENKSIGNGNPAKLRETGKRT